MPFIRTKRIGNTEFYYLVESYRVDGKVRQRVLAYLGQHSTVQAAYDYWRLQMKVTKAADEKQHARQMIEKLKPYL